MEDVSKKKYSRSQYKSGDRKTQAQAERDKVGIAVLRNFKMSARKVRIVADLVRGKKVEFAIGVLKNMKKFAAKPIERTLKSAIANYKNHEGKEHVDDENLKVETIFVDGGFMMKRMRFGAQGRAAYIRKRTSHLTIHVAENA
ncbi:50S ribosomal protein L22 [bacterium]|nr:50S ribosomal protein L22 [bacterium]